MTASSNAKRLRKLKTHVANLGSNDARIAIRSELLLMRWYGRQAARDLIAACDDPKPTVRFRAVWALAHTLAPEAFDVIRRLCDDPDGRVRYDACVGLGIHGDDRAIPELIELLVLFDDSRPATTALARIGPRAATSVLELAGHPDWRVRSAVLDLCSSWMSEDARCKNAVERGLDDPDAVIRANAAFYLDRES